MIKIKKFFAMKKSTDIRWSFTGQYDNDLELQLSDFIDTKAVPEWFKNLSPYINKDLNTKSKCPHESIWDELMSSKFSGTLRTMKSCPAAINYLSHSALIKAPCDILIETSANGEYRWKSLSVGVNISEHGPVQFENSVLSENFIVLKFQIPIAIYSENNTFYFFDSVFNKPQPWRISPGHIDMSVAKQINVIALFPKEDKKYAIECGDPIANIVFFNKPKRWIHDSNVNKALARSVWNMGKTLFGNKQKMSKEK